jgi:hypothetical protein
MLSGTETKPARIADATFKARHAHPAGPETSASWKLILPGTKAVPQTGPTG